MWVWVWAGVDEGQKGSTHQSPTQWSREHSGLRAAPAQRQLSAPPAHFCSLSSASTAYTADANSLRRAAVRQSASATASRSWSAAGGREGRQVGGNNKAGSERVYVSAAAQTSSAARR